jgi:hypothetical protein
MTFHLQLIESIRVRRAHPLRVVVTFFERVGKREVEQTKRGAFVAKGMHTKASLGMQIEKRSTAVYGGRTVWILSRPYS